MITNLIPAISYVLISTFTPGPSNISSASLAVLHGYRNTLKYQLGLAAGVFLLMLLSGWLSTTILKFFPAFEPIMRYVGAAYILYLAFGILKASYTFTETGGEPLGFVHGFILQVLNPKLTVYAFTLFSAFLAPITGNLAFLILAVVLLAAISFCATSTWALFGTAIKTRLRNPRWNRIINIALALLLVYTAIALSGLI
ncbi:MAG TPA: LysE family transporter [Anaerolineales bacterium]|nr:LysE family transporter [Anaerolineales bacterium]HLO30154.1 LysE family transporter [Anaerolineales bacterium]